MCFIVFVISQLSSCFFIVLSFYKRTENNTNMPITDIAKRRLGTNPRRRFLLWYQIEHFTAKPPLKK